MIYTIEMVNGKQFQVTLDETDFEYITEYCKERFYTFDNATGDGTISINLNNVISIQPTF